MRAVRRYSIRCRRPCPALEVPSQQSNAVSNYAPLALLLAVVAWSYWPIAVDLFHTWQTNDDYSVSQLVPLIVMFLLWRERHRLSHCFLSPCLWGGGAFLVLGEAARFYGFFSMRASVTRYSLVLTVMGLVLLVAGRQVFRHVVWILLLLFLMVPAPVRVHDAMAGPLQSMTTNAAVFMLEALGAWVAQEGNVIVLNNTTRFAVAEACSGLRMLTAFIIVAAFIAFMIKRPRWQKGIVLVSSIPVAVTCNILRIVLTAIIMLYVSVELGERFFHDFAGLAMMPVAVSLLLGEIRLIDGIVSPSQKPKSVIVRTFRNAAPGSSGA